MVGRKVIAPDHPFWILMQDTWHIKQISRGDLTVDLAPGIGGRMWNITFNGLPLLFNNPDLMGIIPDMANLDGLPTKSPQFGFPLWGGEKTWVAPDTLWPNGAPYPVLDSGRYETQMHTPEHIVLRSAVCPLSQLQITRDIRLLAGNAMSIEHHLVNRGKMDRFAGIWSVMMLNQPVTIATPSQNPRFDTVFGLANGHVDTSANGVICRCATPAEFKIGTNAQTGRVFMRLGETGNQIWMMAQTDAPSETDIFAHSHNFEVFNSGDYPYCEAEWHGPAASLAPGRTTRFRQTFTLWSDDATDLSQQEQELLICMS